MHFCLLLTIIFLIDQVLYSCGSRVFCVQLLLPRSGLALGLHTGDGKHYITLQHLTDTINYTERLTIISFIELNS